MTATDDPHTWRGARVRNPQGEVLGHVEGVFFHDVTGRATWAAVTDGAGVAMAPLDHAEFDAHGLCLPYRADQLAAAPRPASGAHLDPRTEYELYRHYGLALSEPDGSPTAPPADHQSDRGPDDAVETVVSREELRTRVERRAYARYRLVTYVVTENMTYTVPVSRQEVRLEQIPFDGTQSIDPGTAAEELTEDVHEIVLHREQVHFTKTVVPAERVRLVRRVVQGQQPVSARLRREQVDVEYTAAPVDSNADTPVRGTPRSDR